MIKFDKVSYSFPQKDLYTDVSFTIEEGQHCAFIGASGSGKSTLIDIIMDPEKYVFDGNVEMEPSLKIGYVSQFSQRDKDKETTVFEYIAEEFIKLENEIATLCAEMGTSDDIETLLEKYQEALDAFDAIDGDNYENNINKKLNAANLTTHKDRMISELSGGEFKLIQVIKEMLNNPDLMIMDEPDVFLDFENLNSLKNLINSHKKTILVITHNRYLLNHCFNKIIHLENTELQEFDGRYIDYNFSLLQTKIELQEMAIADEEEIARNEELIKILREKATYGAGSAYLIRKKNGEKITINSQNFAIGKERRRVNYCISDNTSVSRYHVVITKKGSDYYAADQKSSNFTFVNGVQLNPYQETLLTDRSTLKISDEEFEFHAS